MKRTAARRITPECTPDGDEILQCLVTEVV
jgi:hypothetical protein